MIFSKLYEYSENSFPDKNEMQYFIKFDKYLTKV